MYGSISNILIFISLVFTIGAYIFPNLYVLGMNSYFLDNGAYHIYLLQFFSSNFIHGGILHLLFNSVFIYYFGNTLELLIGRAKFLLFFVFVVIFNGITLTYLSSGNTVGISGFAMALLAYYTLELRSKNNPEYKGGITALVINILIGLHPQISIVGHISGAIAGIIFYFINKDYLRRLMQPLRADEIE